MNSREKIRLAIFVFVLANIAFFWPLYFRGLLPFPADLLVSFFFPWSGGGFTGYNSWTTHKEYLAADAIRQMLPWRDLAFELIKKGQFPLWNPYNFSGNYLFANLQSSILFPTNLLFLILPAIGAWVTNVVILMTLFGLFTALFLRSLKLSWPAALFGGVAALSMSYLVGWQEILVNVQSALFLPLILLTVTKYKDTGKRHYLWLTALFIAFSIFGGHVQTTLYVFFIVGAYMLFRRLAFKWIVVSFLGGFLFAAVQLVPSLEAYQFSARETQANISLLESRAFPWPNLVTMFASDFLGNKATYNFQTVDYSDERAYFGVAAMVFFFLSLREAKKEPSVRFFLVLAASGIIFATWPLALIFVHSRIPVLSSAIPARMIFVFEFSAVILSAFGFESWLKTKDKKKIAPVFLLGLVYLLLWFIVLGKFISFATIARNNLIIPTATFLVTTTAINLSALNRKFLWPAVLVILLLAILEPGYYFVKFQPFSKKEFVFPAHPILTYLRDHAGINRFFGSGSSYLDNNFATEYRIFSAEGYDPLYIKRYGELLASSENGQLNSTITRSDAKFSQNDSWFRNRLMDLLGVKYLLDKNDNPKSDWEPEFDRFPQDRFTLVWQEQKWKVYERKTALPRFFLVGDYEVISEPDKIISRLHDADFDIGKKIILEKEAALSLSGRSIGSAKLVSYGPNQVKITVETKGNQLLFLSDSFYPGWRAFEDGNEIPVYRADYALRAVPVSAGRHQILFLYDPESFKLGAAITAGAFLLSLAMVVKSQHKNV